MLLYPHAVGLRAIHVAKKEISKLNRIYPSKEESELAKDLALYVDLNGGSAHIRVSPPFAAPVVQYWGG